MAVNSGLTSYEKILFFQQFIIFYHCFFTYFEGIYLKKSCHSPHEASGKWVRQDCNRHFKFQIQQTSEEMQIAGT